MSKVQKVDTMFEFLRVVLGIIIAFLCCIVIIVLMSDNNAGEAVYNFMVGPFMTKRRFGMVLAKYSSYLMTGIGMCFIYAAGRFNMAGEGSINLAPMPVLVLMFGTTFGTEVMAGLPQWLNLTIIVVMTALTAAAIHMIPAFGREHLGANEMVTSTIVNYFCMYAAMWILRGTIADRSLSTLSTANYLENMRFTRYWNRSNFTSGFWLALVVGAIGCIVYYRTTLGTKIRICGDNLQFAIYSGINARRMMYAAQLVGGLFAGVGAAIEVFGLYDAFYLQALTNVGMDGLLVAVMAKKSPIFCFVTAFVMSYIRQAAAVLNANTNIPVELVTMLQAVIVLFVAAEEFLGKSRRKAIVKISREEEAKAAAAKEVA